MQGTTVFQREGVIAYRYMFLTSGQPPTATATVPLSVLALRGAISVQQISKYRSPTGRLAQSLDHASPSAY